MIIFNKNYPDVIPIEDRRLYDFIVLQRQYILDLTKYVNSLNDELIRLNNLIIENN